MNVSLVVLNNRHTFSNLNKLDNIRNNPIMPTLRTVYVNDINPNVCVFVANRTKKTNHGNTKQNNTIDDEDAAGGAGGGGRGGFASEQVHQQGAPQREEPQEEDSRRAAGANTAGVPYAASCLLFQAPPQHQQQHQEEEMAISSSNIVNPSPFVHYDDAGITTTSGRTTTSSNFSRSINSSTTTTTISTTTTTRSRNLLASTPRTASSIASPVAAAAPAAATLISSLYFNNYEATKMAYYKQLQQVSRITGGGVNRSIGVLVGTNSSSIMQSSSSPPGPTGDFLVSPARPNNDHHAQAAGNMINITSTAGLLGNSNNNRFHEQESSTRRRHESRNAGAITTTRSSAANLTIHDVLPTVVPMVSNVQTLGSNAVSNTNINSVKTGGVISSPRHHSFLVLLDSHNEESRSHNAVATLKSGGNLTSSFQRLAPPITWLRQGLPPQQASTVYSTAAASKSAQQNYSALEKLIPQKPLVVHRKPNQINDMSSSLFPSSTHHKTPHQDGVKSNQFPSEANAAFAKTQNYYHYARIPPGSLLISEKEREKLQDLVSEFTMAVFSQLILVQFDEKDRIEKRSKSHQNTLIGYTGVACRYCLGRGGEEKNRGIFSTKADIDTSRRSGRYFPTRFRTFKDARTLRGMFLHFTKSCHNHTPKDVREKLLKLSQIHYVHGGHRDKIIRKHGALTRFHQILWNKLRSMEKPGIS